MSVLKRLNDIEYSNPEEDSMDMKTFYEKIDSDYDSILQRLGNDERMYKYLGIFAQDQNFDLLKNALEKENQKTAFLAVHTIKGIAVNLGFNHLYENAYGLTELLREDDPDMGAVKNSFVNVEKAYNQVMEAIAQLDR